ncbi:MAG: hypothetical protein HYZ69_01235 [Candidatus Colwellbacteria bacterium]|nr:hypothetical protein [Candidatus Colwellbacteria bacterium]
MMDSNASQGQSLYGKEVLLGSVALLTGVFVFWFWQRDISRIVSGVSKNYLSFLFPFFGLMLAAAFFSLSALFVKNRNIAYASALAGAGIPFFFVEATSIVIGTFFLSMALAAIAVAKIRREFTLTLGFSASKILKQGLPIYFTIASLIVTVFYLSGLDDKKALASFLPKSAIDASFNLPIAQALNLPPINAKTTVDEFLSGLLKEQLQSQGALPSEIRESELTRAIGAERRKFSEQYGIALQGNERVADVFYAAITGYIEKILGPYKRYLPFAAAAAFFFAFKTLTFFLYYLTLPLVFLLIRLMIASTLLKKEKQNIAVEKLTLL